MNDILSACKLIFNRSPLAVGVFHVLRDNNGVAYDFVYEYANDTLAAITGQTVDELVGTPAFSRWADGDETWLEHMDQAAYEGQAVEFDVVSVALQEFDHVLLFPIVEGHCAMVLQDVTSWVSQATLSMKSASMGLFFYDRRTRLVMLAPAARELCDLEVSYTSITQLIISVFGDEDLDELRKRLQQFHKTGDFQHEGRVSDGRWIRLSLVMAEGDERFAYGLLEDVTRAKEAEADSLRRTEIIDSLTRENFALYLADLEADTIEAYRLQESAKDTMIILEGHPSYTEAITKYARTFVVPDDRERVEAEMGAAAVRQRLQEGGDFSLNYRRVFDSSADTEGDYVETRFLRLSDSNRHVVLAARTVNDEVQEQLRQKAALQTALDLAEHANEAKSTFLTNMSHDFRTPLNAISGFAGIALAHLDDTERVCDCLQKIILSSDHLVDLVNDILDVSRVESGKLSLAEEPLNLIDLGRSVSNLFAEQAAQAGVTFSVMASHITHKDICADQLRLNQILINVLGNAIKFTPAGGTVTMALNELSTAPAGYGTYQLVVTDTGIGMSEAFMEKLFLPFEREAKTRPNTAVGTGLGMAITKSLVDLMGGTIEVESEVGRGTTFTITLPLRLRRAGDDEPEAADADNAGEKPDFTGLRALVADDDDLSREITMAVLSEYGLAFEEARDGNEAVQMVTDSEPFHYDVVIMDMRMPNMNGDVATKAIRALDRPDTADLPIIAVTADAFEEGRRRAHDAGMTAHATKPLNVRQLVSLLHKHVVPRAEARRREQGE